MLMIPECFSMVVSILVSFILFYFVVMKLVSHFFINSYYIYACYRPNGRHLAVRMGLFKSSFCIMTRDCRALERSFILHQLIPALLEGFSPSSTDDAGISQLVPIR